jgi:hypothetical protein
MPSKPNSPRSPASRFVRAWLPVPEPARYEIRTFLADEGYVGEIVQLTGDPPRPAPWHSRPFRTVAAAWRTLLRELARRQGLL